MDLLGRIEALEIQFSTREPEVLAFLPEWKPFDRLRREGEGLVKAYPEPGQRPPLYGVLLGVKDIFHVDGFPTHGGSLLPPEALGGPEAASVTPLRRAGALVVGKTVTTEFAYFAPGPTRNPHNPWHTPGGSSSGSAAAVAAGLCDLALGTQTIGSVNRPAAFCGVVGYKPTYDRIFKKGVIPLAPSLDHVGFFTREVDLGQRTAALLVRDWQGNPEISRPVLGIPEGPYLSYAEKQGLDHFEACSQKLREAGFVVHAVPALPDFDAVVHRHNLILAAEAFQVHRDWYDAFGDRYQPKTAELIEKGSQIEIAALEEALSRRETLRNDLARLMEDHTIDLWITPSAPGPAPFGLDSTGNPVMNLPWTQAGLPTLTLPAGTAVEGLPMGLQFVAGWNGDEALFQWGRILENALREFSN